jgi:quinoprotein glucose dehydrogenase
MLGAEPRRHAGQALTFALALFLAAFPATGQHGASPDAWLSVGGDSGFTKYSPLAQIDATNVHQLAVLWEWEVPDAPILRQHPQMGATNFQGTPLFLDGALYGTTPLSQAYAVDARTGTTLWVYDPKSYDVSRRGGGLTFLNRGLAFWRDPKTPLAASDAAAPGVGLVGARLFLVAGDARLFALDPRTGAPIESFGERGMVDTKAGIPRLPATGADREYSFGSAPLVCRDVVVVGSRIADRPVRKSQPPGWVRGYDARTGGELWSFHSVPLPGELGFETWENGAADYSGGANVWTLLSADEERGIVYLPFGTATNDFYGGARLGDNLFAETLVALDCATGRRLWHFQAVHHGLWDYDLPTPPTLADLEIGGHTVPALALPTKHGFLFVLDRRTGEPLFPVEERQVPASDVPGERASPTQPHADRPAPFERQGVTEDDLIDFTPELRAEALAILRRYRSGPLFTPPSLEGTVQLPGYGGGANWPGAALDPETGVLYVPSMTRPMLLRLVRPDPSRSEHPYVLGGGDAQGPQGLPLVKPPYGRVTAIDLRTGDHLWMVANGGDGPRDYPALRHLGLPPLGSPGRAVALVTKTLLFVSEGSGRTGSAIGGGTGLRVLDKANGAELHRLELHAQITGLLATFELDGRQVLVAPLGSDPPKLVAISLASE